VNDGPAATRRTSTPRGASAGKTSRMRILACVSLCIVLAACGSGASTTATTPAPKTLSRIDVLERDLSKQLGLDHASCEHVMREGEQPGFICLVISHGHELKLTVDQPTERSTPRVRACKLAHEGPHLFGTCAVGPGGKGGRPPHAESGF
jgi:hypothetical protein